MDINTKELWRTLSVRHNSLGVYAGNGLKPIVKAVESRSQWQLNF